MCIKKTNFAFSTLGKLYFYDFFYFILHSDICQSLRNTHANCVGLMTRVGARNSLFNFHLNTIHEISVLCLYKIYFCHVMRGTGHHIVCAQSRIGIIPISCNMLRRNLLIKLKCQLDDITSILDSISIRLDRMSST